MLIDSDVLIDYLRGYEKAIDWLHSISEPISISGYSYFELVEGCRNTKDLQRLEKFISVFEVLWLEEKEIQHALSILKINKFKNGMGFIDCLIGQTCISYKRRLYTFNLKHYKAFPGIKISKPYEK
ncbi:type II toxin-antitoxin system VapC family toxin [Leptospira santarosai]|uniref:type II toxin-antitoxin system VapC family toxin n=1 Tax=Leptospira santarosai TaxID=28183 RepID=UPI000961D030|nr:type II toxin-antitoxin system VapC family toxin [Leptospira santarosai]OLY64806.1 VapC toxin family PIN domain ribonuclease [Leptospira santarosai serovar Grippotyphosa]ONF77764.1 VapC toxin family PIN domain ribonuclease [Leptospira santarosai serovar Bananal]